MVVITSSSFFFKLIKLMNVLRVMDGTKIKLHDIGLRRPSLDDVFLNLTGHTPEEAETIEIKR